MSSQCVSGSRYPVRLSFNMNIQVLQTITQWFHIFAFMLPILMTLDTNDILDHDVVGRRLRGGLQIAYATLHESKNIEGL